MTNPIKIYIFPCGMGDAVMALAVAHNYYCQTGKAMHIGHKCADLFLNNPEIVCHPEYAYWSLDAQSEERAKKAGYELVSLFYFAFRQVSSNYWKHYNPKQSLIGLLCQQAGLSGNVSLTPKLLLSHEENDFGAFAEGKIAVISTGVASYKSWSVKKMQAVIDAFPKESFIQLGVLTDPLLSGVEDCRGKLTLRQLAGVLAHARLFLGPVGGMMHLARSVNSPSLILLPSFEEAIWHYSSFDYVTPAQRCLLCDNFQTNPGSCPQPENCMNISSEVVISRLREVLGHPKCKLHEEHATITSLPVKGLDYYHKMNSSLFFGIEVTFTSTKEEVWDTRMLSLDNKAFDVVFPFDKQLTSCRISITRKLGWLYSDVQVIFIRQNKTSHKIVPSKIKGTSSCVIDNKRHWILFCSKGVIDFQVPEEASDAEEICLHFKAVPVEQVVSGKRGRLYRLKSMLLCAKACYYIQHLLDVMKNDSPWHVCTRSVKTFIRWCRF